MSLTRVVLDIPHGGEEVPSEVEEYLHPEISSEDLLREADLCASGFYREQAEIPQSNIMWFDHSRAIIDTNRYMDDYGRDGIFKTRTSHDKPLYKNENGGLPEEAKRELLKKYARPYYERLYRAVEKPDTDLVVLCHTMDPVGPAAGVSPGKKRPLVSVCNGGEASGEPDGNKPYQASREVMEFIKDELEKRAGNLNMNGTVTNGNIAEINSPFSAGTHIDRIGPGRLRGKKAFLIEVNKSLVIDAKTLEVRRPENVFALRKIFHDILEGVLGRI